MEKEQEKKLELDGIANRSWYVRETIAIPIPVEVVRHTETGRHERVRADKLSILSGSVAIARDHDVHASNSSSPVTNGALQPFSECGC